MKVVLRENECTQVLLIALHVQTVVNWVHSVDRATKNLQAAHQCMRRNIQRYYSASAAYHIISVVGEPFILAYRQLTSIATAELLVSYYPEFRPSSW